MLLAFVDKNSTSDASTFPFDSVFLYLAEQPEIQMPSEPPAPSTARPGVGSRLTLRAMYRRKISRPTEGETVERVPRAGIQSSSPLEIKCLNSAGTSFTATSSEAGLPGRGTARMPNASGGAFCVATELIESGTICLRSASSYS